MKQKKCKGCGDSFTPLRPMQSACSTLCALNIAKAKRERAQKVEAKKERKADRERKEKLKSLPEWKEEAQKAFNTYIRKRDANKPCICCGKPLGLGNIGGAYDCGHFRSVGSAPHLRFDERNAHAQRKYCNRWRAGRAVDYRLGLIERIGLEAVEALESDQSVKKYTIEELKAIKKKYSALARQLTKNA